MRLIFLILIILAVCYVLLLDVPESPGKIQFAKFYHLMKAEVHDLFDHFSLMQNPWVKVTLIAGAALIFAGFFRQVAK
ncbi:MAG: hypothetical protein GWN00_00485 [Aliifodinibius sp.]|nr:hypothetical protein [candidate division Zixibacteria bacterium]NIT54757.1 hypothetical protein [Fodinibius sp.]NIW39165.1 hypothetical protein [candidate division Zixibacteria bacterium]NIX54426.1 hypothetical protein [candidate division Zixibacteria bacterium]NIY23341.1 hypothetical protein [Fodinibius sp.]